MDAEILISKLERVHHLADILLDLLAWEPRLQTLTELIREISTLPEA